MKIYSMIFAIPIFFGSDQTFCQKIVIGPAECLYTNAQLPPAPLPGGKLSFDGTIATVTNNSSTLKYFFPMGWGGIKLYTGTLSSPFGPINSTTPTEVWSRSRKELFPNDPFLQPSLRDDATHNYSAAAWIPSIYQIDNTHYLGFVHVENMSVTGMYDTQTLYSIGLAYSADQGLTWKYLGDILQTKSKDGQNTNIGGVPYLVVGQYLYVYFNDYPTTTSRAMAVARAPLASVISAAQSGTVIQWNKYNSNNLSNGGFNESGLTGLGSNIIPTHPSYTNISKYDMHSDAIYSRAIGKYFLTVWVANQALLLYSSTDGINWNNPNLIDSDPANNTMFSFSTFAALSGTTPDLREAGRQFYIIYPRKDPTIYFHDDIFRKKISVAPDMDPIINRLLR